MQSGEISRCSTASCLHYGVEEVSVYKGPPRVRPPLAAQALVSKLKGSSAAAAVAAVAPPSAASPAVVAAVSHPQLASPGSSIAAVGGGTITISSPGGGSSSMAAKDAKAVVSSEAGVVRSVLATLGALAQQAGTGFKPFVAEVMPLVIEAIQVRETGAPAVGEGVCVSKVNYALGTCKQG